MPELREPLFRKVVRRTRDLWEWAKSERASPKQVGWAVFVGVYAGCTPLVGLHGWLAVALATVLRLNRLYCVIGSRISNFVIYPWLVLAEVQLAHKVRTGAWVPLDVHEAVRGAADLLLDWCIGSVAVGLVLATLLGFSAYWIALRRASPARRP